MIISHKYKYLFVELPHTGATSIAAELCATYHGKPIMRKHEYYHEFRRIADSDEKDLFIFSCIRNPLDEAVSAYFRLKQNRPGDDSDSKQLRKQGGHLSHADLQGFQFLQESGADFAQFFRKFYKPWKIHRYPYDNWSSLDHKNFDYIIRFENLEADFAEVLKRLSIRQKRPLPLLDQTNGNLADYQSFFTPDIRARAKRIFGPFMQKWGYDFPEEWQDGPVTPLNNLHFRLLGICRNTYLRTFGHDSVFQRYLE